MPDLFNPLSKARRKVDYGLTKLEIAVLLLLRAATVIGIVVFLIGAVVRLASVRLAGLGTWLLWIGGIGGGLSIWLAYRLGAEDGATGATIDSGLQQRRKRLEELRSK
ncbi:hypothetical protein [Hymenobacter sp. B81]|uniref:hypothetical protein n=1 Tax=Hymenobacter sp. B81 TaxID=3344878 RepID=UPI0037DD4B28